MKKVIVEITDKLFAEVKSLVDEGRYATAEDAFRRITEEVVESNWAFPELEGKFCERCEEEAVGKAWSDEHLNGYPYCKKHLEQAKNEGMEFKLFSDNLRRKEN